jgi:NADH-quinone oxidoreductase subunit J
MHQALFFVFAAAALGFAINLLIQRQPAYGALSLMGVTASLAPLYLMLGAEFIAAAQVLFCAGAALVLLVFAILLVNARVEAPSEPGSFVRHLGAPVIVLLAGLVVAVIYRQFPAESVARFGDFPGQTASIGRRLFLQYLLPFEALSILILVAIVGAVTLAQRRTDRNP